ncbi:zinc-ribbon and DUF3426 domain-containing protein [Rhodoferax sp.]|uniref:zinc-ribbon and DUF3426 domain-containing protein n=1 Tax=Rhodoferax sp. TaxID=50421 RepID=UPI0026389CA4|nr:zinc-ribbon and DUF3426 domain-containing protein [Rhodoferax sp.]MDD2919759.1 zinc-ribbon and DUF3426 domain-containing protein [Rhodoferax sp.]
MSLIARCPACQTWYKVVPDQLRISGGWVRCGTCGEIFDVSQQLIEADSELPADLASTDAREFLLQPVAADLALRDSSTRLAEPVTVESRSSYGDEAPAMPPATEDFRPDVEPDVRPEESWDSAALLIKPSMEIEAEAAPESVYEPEPEVPEPVAAAPVPVTEPVSFMRAVVVRPDLHQHGKRLLWGVLCVLLLLGLLVQGMYRERDQWATLKPEIKPVLQTFCKVLGCRISPVQRIEALILDSATFHQVDQETFQLHLVVKNKTQLALALPAVELTLTDLTDQPVMRRVLLPAELGAKSDTVAAVGEWSAMANLRVKADTAQPSALGYRLLLFYP